MDEIKILLENYTALVEKIDSHIKAVMTDFADHIQCKKGCDNCCRHLNLFPVEALAIARAFAELPPEIQRNVLKQTNGKGCPLLIQGECVAYEARPLICRTHGMPIYMENDGKITVDFCPMNFSGITQFPKESLLNLDQLNITLTAVNARCVEQIETTLPERIPMDQALELLM